MYDENDLYNEVGNTIKSTVSNAKTIYDFMEKIKAGTPETLTGVNSDFVFTGQSTDLSYFYNFNEMPIELIEKIPNETLKNAVKDEFNKAVLDGKLEIDTRKGIVKITNKGRKFINKPKFQEALQQNTYNMISQQMQEQILGFELDGSIQDLNFFNFSEKLDLTEIIKNPDTSAVQKIMGNLAEMEKSGFIKMENSFIRITDKGKEIINSDMFKLATKGATEKLISNLGGISGKIFIITKKLLNSAVQNAVQNSLNTR